MRKILVLALVAFAAAGPAMSKEMKGVVSEIDAEAHTVMLEGNDEELKIVDSVDASDIEVGDEVSLMTDDSTGEVTDIYIAE